MRNKMLLIGATSVLFLSSGCTLSFTNVMTSGEATDVVDSDPKTDAKIDSNISVPVSGI